ncbi:unnamed protein product [Protopolystoma xenopodis]|uniref:Uncharacterized protein n=1 Tax=Protopolystoma xenopodis TaxID=117903 RepID=A0A3S5FCB3_9PLAT|nr:unnamed protein product [Protopolystoma xenopodis]
MWSPSICSEHPIVHETAFACLQEFVSHCSIDIELRHANVKPILQNVRQPTSSMRPATARQLAYCAQLFPSTFSERLCEAINTHLTTLVDDLANKQNPASVTTLVPYLFGNTEWLLCLNITRLGYSKLAPCSTRIPINMHQS